MIVVVMIIINIIAITIMIVIITITIIVIVIVTLMKYHALTWPAPRRSAWRSARTTTDSRPTESLYKYTHI